MDLFNNMLEKFSSKKVGKERTLLYSNIWLIPTALTFVVFNIMKTKVFDGHIIGLMELFYTGLMLFVGFYFASKNFCCKKPQMVESAIQNALMVLLVSVFATSINPCKGYMKSSHVVMYNVWIIGVAYNIVLYMMKKEYCNKKPNNKYTWILLGLHLLRLYFLR